METTNLGIEEKGTVVETLKPFLYDPNRSTIVESLNGYIEWLKEHPQKTLCYRHNVMMQEKYLKMLTNKSFIKEVRKYFDQIYKELEKTNLLFKLDGRRKSLHSFEQKVAKELSQGNLTEVKDIYAFRIIIFDQPNADMQAICYSVMDQLIESMSTAGFLPKRAKKAVSTRSIYLKDYIEHPKCNGYQSLHVIFEHVDSGHMFEVQVRSLSMHKEAESGIASHSEYKKDKYSFSTVYDGIELDKVNLVGFIYSSPDDFADEIGLIRSVNIFSRQKTF